MASAVISARERPWSGRLRLGRAAWALLAVALIARFAFIAATPGYELVHDARDYDRHAISIANGEGYPPARAPGRPSAFRPPAYPHLLAGAYVLAGVERGSTLEERARVARGLGAIIGVGIVGLIGLLAALVWDRRVALVAMGLAAIYLPLVYVNGSAMSEPLFALLVLAALAVVAAARPSPHRYRWALAAGVLAGLTVLTRANALVLLAPLAFAVWHAPRRSWRSLGPPAVLVAVTLLTVSPWTIRNAVVFDTFVPVTTQFGSAFAGTYNDMARNDREQPASWRSLRWIPEYRDIWADVRRTPEPEFERRIRARAFDYIAEHPGYVLTVAYWNTRRMLDTTGLKWSGHTLATIGVPRRYAPPMLACFWLFAVVALVGAFTRGARRAPLWLWSVPVLLYLSVVFLVFETPRYRTGIDPFIVMLAALALCAAYDRVRAVRA